MTCHHAEVRRYCQGPSGTSVCDDSARSVFLTPTTSDFSTEFSPPVLPFTNIKMVADAVIYHPTVAHYLRFVATTGNRGPAFNAYLATALLPISNSMLISSRSWSRQAPSYPSILLPFLRLVPLPHQQPYQAHCPLRSYQKELRAHTQSATHWQECGALQSRCGGS